MRLLLLERLVLAVVEKRDVGLEDATRGGNVIHIDLLDRVPQSIANRHEGLRHLGLSAAEVRRSAR